MKYCQLCWLCQATLAAYSSDTLHWRSTIMNRDNARDGDDDDGDGDGDHDDDNGDAMVVMMTTMSTIQW